MAYMKLEVIKGFGAIYQRRFTHYLKSFVEEALYTKEEGVEFPFIILLRESDKIIGSTRFLDISTANKSLEIGWTWYTPSVWGNQINMECKYLLLKYCFETLQIIRI